MTLLVSLTKITKTTELTKPPSKRATKCFPEEISTSQRKYG